MCRPAAVSCLGDPVNLSSDKWSLLCTGTLISIFTATKIYLIVVSVVFFKKPKIRKCHVFKINKTNKIKWLRNTKRFFKNDLEQPMAGVLNWTIKTKTFPCLTQNPVFIALVTLSLIRQTCFISLSSFYISVKLYIPSVTDKSL